MMKNIYAYLILISLLNIGCTANSKGISGTVIDAETNKPIEGAVVLVEWTFELGIGDKHTVSSRVIEKITDKEGNFAVSGSLNPCVDPPDVTIYKKGYVTWNNKRIYPDYKQRQASQNSNISVKLELFKEYYSHNQHLSFIRLCSNDLLSSAKKKQFTAAYIWEIDSAREEVLKEQELSTEKR